MATTRLKCFCCDKEIEVDDEFGNAMVLHPAYGGIWFRAYGNFGSTVFDPIVEKLGGTENFLKILICDECVVQQSKVGKVTQVYDIHKIETASSRIFEP